MKYFVLMFALMLIGCTNEKTSTSKEKFGHWKYKGSSTFEQRFQCVQQFMPRQNINCEEGVVVCISKEV